jgi:hypothetical protein
VLDCRVSSWASAGGFFSSSSGSLPGRLLGRKAAIAGALLSLLFVGAVTASVFGEDDYVANGSSNWSNRSSSAHWIYGVAVGVALAGMVLFALAAEGKLENLRALFVGSGITDFFMAWVVAVAFLKQLNVDRSERGWGEIRKKRPCPPL